MLDATPILGLLAGLVGVADTLPYVRDTVRGRTRPHRGTWLIWGILAIVVCVSQRAEGASWSLVLTAVVFALAIRHGEGGVTVVELSVVAVACAGIAGWFLAREPLVAVACVIAADLSAAAMMTPKAYRDPTPRRWPCTHWPASAGRSSKSACASGWDESATSPIRHPRTTGRCTNSVQPSATSRPLGSQHQLAATKAPRHLLVGGEPRTAARRPIQTGAIPAESALGAETAGSRRFACVRRSPPTKKPPRLRGFSEWS